MVHIQNNRIVLTVLLFKNHTEPLSMNPKSWYILSLIEVIRSSYTYLRVFKMYETVALQSIETSFKSCCDCEITKGQSEMVFVESDA